MFLSLSVRTKTSIGLDIQANEIRILELHYSKKQFSVVQAVAVALPAGAIVDGIIQQSEKVGYFLKSLVQTTQLSGHKVAMALPIHRVLTTKLPMLSSLSKMERLAEIDENIHRYFATPDEALVYDYTVVGTGDGSTENVLLVAAREKELISWIKLVESAGVIVDQVDIDTYALIRAVEFSMQNAAALIFFVDQHDDRVYIIVAYKNEIIYQQKLHHPSITEVCRYVQYGLQFCRQRFVSVPLPTVYCFNMDAACKEAMQKILGLAMQCINPFEKMSYPAEVAKSLKKMLLCCGLALRRLHND